MRIEQLTYFLEVAKTHSINKAAENLFVTQPGLSDSIKKMESELGLKLLNRSKTGVSLTESGKIVVQHAYTILEAYEDMLRDLSIVNSPEHAELKGTVTIATPPLFAASVLTDVNTLFRNRFFAGQRSLHGAHGTGDHQHAQGTAGGYRFLRDLLYPQS